MAPHPQAHLSGSLPRLALRSLVCITLTFLAFVASGRQASAQSLKAGYEHTVVAKPDADGFIVSRPVGCGDQSVYQLTAQVSAEGMYFELSRRRVLKRANAIGIVHVSEH